MYSDTYSVNFNHWLRHWRVCLWHDAIPQRQVLTGWVNCCKTHTHSSMMPHSLETYHILWFLALSWLSVWLDPDFSDCHWLLCTLCFDIPRSTGGTHKFESKWMRKLEERVQGYVQVSNVKTFKQRFDKGHFAWWRTRWRHVLPASTLFHRWSRFRLDQRS